MEGRAGRGAAKGQAVVARGLAVEGTAAVAGVEEEAPPAAERMAWVEVAGGRVKEVASEGGRVEVMEAERVWEGVVVAAEMGVARAVETLEMAVAGKEAETVARAGAMAEGMAAVKAAVSLVVAARAAAAPSSGRSSRGAWTQMGGMLHLQ